MRRLSPRVVLAIAVIAALPVAGLIASARSASSMAAAADNFLASLTPEEKQQAALPFEGDEPTKWHYIPNEMFPRKGLQLKDMTDAQRTLAHDLMKTGLSQRGFMTATSIMALEDVLRGIEAAAGDPGAGGRRFARNPLEVLLHRVRHAFSEGQVGLARQRASRVAALHDRQRHRRGDLADVLRLQSGGSPRRTEEGDCGFSADRRTPARALLMALDDAQRAKAVDPERRAQRDRHDQQGEDRSALAGRALPRRR